uniref:Venom allergen 2 n=1 Tax=Solenopsis saevissima TaxID=176597 RepID=VA2_SOLSV|nr:RecName: Full=Venom allergen 2; AltName: Allergen=Sol s 2; Flags: Precursor [Solenopsis saevissima]ABC58726.1 Sol s 2 allergen [Solenopsis saevissima]
MKSFVLATCLLGFAQIIYADTEKLKILRKDIAKCARTLPKCVNQPDDPLARVDVWHCALAKSGVFDDPDPAAIKKKYKKFCAIAVTDPANVENCKKVTSRCVDKETQCSKSNRQKAINIAACILRSGVTETTVLAREK